MCWELGTPRLLGLTAQTLANWVSMRQVEYFKKRRVMEHKRETMLKKLEEEGAKPIQMPNPVGNAQKEP